MTIRAKVLTGSSDEGVDGLKVLAIQVLAQAVRDARCRNPRLQHDALGWLNAPEGRELADALGVRRWANKQQITWGDLPRRVRDTWFLGGAS